MIEPIPFDDLDPIVAQAWAAARARLRVPFDGTVALSLDGDLHCTGTVSAEQRWMMRLLLDELEAVGLVVERHDQPHPDRGYTGRVLGWAEGRGRRAPEPAPATSAKTPRGICRACRKDVALLVKGEWAGTPREHRCPHKQICPPFKGMECPYCQPGGNPDRGPDAR